MNATDIVGATWEADTYCVSCTQERFAGIVFGGPERGNDDEYADSEGNPVRPIFASEVHSGDSPDYCGSCGMILAPYECSICGDEHGESAHGDPLVMRDMGQRTITEAVHVNLMDAASLLWVDGPAGRDMTTDAYLDVDKLRREWETLSTDGRDSAASEYLDDIDSILTDAGYLPITNADQGTWSVYAPTVSDVESAVGTG